MNQREIGQKEPTLMFAKTTSRPQISFNLGCEMYLYVISKNFGTLKNPDLQNSIRLVLWELNLNLSVDSFYLKMFVKSFNLGGFVFTLGPSLTIVKSDWTQVWQVKKSDMSQSIIQYSWWIQLYWPSSELQLELCTGILWVFRIFLGLRFFFLKNHHQLRSGFNAANVILEKQIKICKKFCC